MKAIVPVLLMLFTSMFVNAQSNKDLPAPVANLQTLAAGSYVIPMDNILQLNTAGYFNLKSYGLIVHLLNNGVKVKWAIRAGKTKDGIDFSGSALRILPTQALLPSVYNFLAGPFVIAAADTTGVAAIIQNFYTTNVLSANDRPAVYRLTLSVSNVDIRYDLTGFKPNAIILNDGRFPEIHQGYMTKSSIPATNYEIGSAAGLLSRCYTFASEPHITSDRMNSSYVDAVQVFTKYGGNFLAQCEAIGSYENHASGRFHTTAGLRVINFSVKNEDTRFHNPDLAFSQFQGGFSINQSGTIRNWGLTTGSSYQNNSHAHATGNPSAPIGASVAKMNAASQEGGLVFYLGNHEFSSVNTYESINGIRMYMNAFLTPTALNRNCSMGTFLLAVLSLELEEFNAQQKNGNAELIWTANRNSTASQFIVERSTDGVNFFEAGIVFSKNGMEEAAPYKFKEAIRTAAGSTVYYRIRTEDNRGNYKYSETRLLKIGSNGSISITTFPNPVVSQLTITLPAEWNNKQINYEVVDINGKQVARFNGAVISQIQELNLAHLKAGYYILRVSCNGEQISKKILKK